MQTPVRVIIAGSRNFDDMNLLIEKCDKILSGIMSEITIISGGAKGADLMGEAYSALRGHKLQVFEADWKLHGKSAGYRRNEQMADAATHCIVFWNGRSPGSRHMAEIAHRKNLKTRIISF